MWRKHSLLYVVNFLYRFYIRTMKSCLHKHLCTIFFFKCWKGLICFVYVIINNLLNNNEEFHPAVNLYMCKDKTKTFCSIYSSIHSTQVHFMGVQLQINPFLCTPCHPAVTPFDPEVGYLKSGTSSSIFTMNVNFLWKTRHYTWSIHTSTRP